MTDDLQQPHVHEYVESRTTSTSGSESTLTDLLCVISPHEKGFWQADVYEAGCDDGEIPPIWFATGKKGGDRYGVINKASAAYPGIKFIAGQTGYCQECDLFYYDLETNCECGELLST